MNVRRRFSVDRYLKLPKDGKATCCVRSHLFYIVPRKKYISHGQVGKNYSESHIIKCFDQAAACSLCKPPAMFQPVFLMPYSDGGWPDNLWYLRENILMSEYLENEEGQDPRQRSRTCPFLC